MYGIEVGDLYWTRHANQLQHRWNEEKQAGATTNGNNDDATSGPRRSSRTRRQHRQLQLDSSKKTYRTS